MIDFDVPVVQAPMAGGPSTPSLAAAVSSAGGLGFLAAGYKTPEAVLADITATRELTQQPFGVNVFAPSGGPADRDTVDRYADRLRDQAAALGVVLGDPRFDEDHYQQKVELLVQERVAVVSFTFGCPAPVVVQRLQQVGTSVWVTVTDPQEAVQAAAAGADALVVQGVEAGGHRGSFADSDSHEDYGILALLSLVSARVDLPLIAAGGIATGSALAGVLAAGAAAAAIGTAFLRCPEAGTDRSAPERGGAAPTHRADAGVLRPPRPRPGQHLPSRPHRGRPHRLPGAAPPDHAAARARPRERRRGADEPVGGPGARARPDLPAGQLAVELAEDAATALDRLTKRLG